MYKFYDIITFVLFGHYSDLVFKVYTFDPEIVKLNEIIVNQIPLLFNQYKEKILDIIYSQVPQQRLGASKDPKITSFLYFYETYPTIDETFTRLMGDCLTIGRVGENISKQINNIIKVLEYNNENIKNILEELLIDTENQYVQKI